MRQKELRSLRFYRLLYSIVAESFRRFSILAKIVLIIQDSLTKEFCVGAYLCKAENCCSLERRSAGVVNRSLGDRLRCLVGDHIANWYQVLPMAEFAYNSSVSRTTGRSPCSLSRFDLFLKEEGTALTLSFRWRNNILISRRQTTFHIYGAFLSPSFS